MNKTFGFNAKYLNFVYKNLFLKSPSFFRKAFYRSFSALTRHSLSSSKSPARLIFYATNKCNLTCQHCFNAGIKKDCPPGELSVSEIKKINFLLPSSVKLITITGGEPMLRKDLFEVCEIFLKSRRMSLSINTNGYFPEETERLAKKLLSLFSRNCFNFQVSLDGFRETHNRIRGDPSSFDKSMDTIARLKKLYSKYNNFGKLSILTTVSKMNIQEVRPFYKFIRENHGLFHKFQMLREGSGNKEFVSRNSLDPAQVREIVKLLQENLKEGDSDQLFNILEIHTWNSALEIQKNKKRAFECAAGRAEGVIYHDGAVGLCEETAPAGYLRDCAYDFGAIWRSSNADKLREKMKDCACFNFCHIASSLVFNRDFLKDIFQAGS
ncbi:MAG: radical SAM protein [Candidatus Omnitrophica bacterium]|nr:radical SAM protein [Candidatus Omnitrophota bacterium]